MKEHAQMFQKANHLEDGIYQPTKGMYQLS